MPYSDCTIMEEIGTAQFARRLRAGDKHLARVPFSASMDWTEQCNLRCRHCFIRDTSPISEEMTAAQLRSVLNKLAAGGVLFLVITGGEPLMRADFRDLYLYAKQRGFILTLFTNGTLIDDDLADFLAAWPPRRIEITLYGATIQTTEAVTGIADSFRRCRQGIERLLRRGLLVRLKAMLMRSNVHEFDALREWARRQGCDFRYDALIHPRLDGNRAPTAERLLPETTVRLQFEDTADRSAFQDYYRQNDALPGQQLLFECGAGVKTLHVDARGRAHPCMLWRADPYDLLTGALDDVWHRHLAAILRRPAPTGDCAQCADRGLCNCCPPLGLLETGTPGKKAAYYCDLAAARKHKLNPK